MEARQGSKHRAAEPKETRQGDPIKPDDADLGKAGRGDKRNQAARSAETRRQGPKEHRLWGPNEARPRGLKLARRWGQMKPGERPTGWEKRKLSGAHALCLDVPHTLGLSLSSPLPTQVLVPSPRPTHTARAPSSLRGLVQLQPLGPGPIPGTSGSPSPSHRLQRRGAGGGEEKRRETAWQREGRAAAGGGGRERSGKRRGGLAGGAGGGVSAAGAGVTSSPALRLRGH